VDKWTTHVTTNLVVLYFGYFLVLAPGIERLENFLGRHERSLSSQ